MTFHGPERFHHQDAHGHGDHHHTHVPHESPLVVTAPLIALAIPSAIIGFITVGPVLFGGYFGDAIFVREENDVIGEIGREFHGPLGFALNGITHLPFLLALAGVATAWVFFLWRPQLADLMAKRLSAVRAVLVNKYFFDWFNETILAGSARLLGVGLWRAADQGLIDGAMVNGSAHTVGWMGSVVRRVQSGYLYSYAFWMIIGLAVLLGWFLFKP
jgi:NADH-quinone oxidoreductase subunit L